MLLPQTIMQLVDVNGLPRAFAEASFTLTGTTTPTTVYADADLSTPISQPVTADDEGIFPTVYVSNLILTRMRVIEATGDFATPLKDIDPINEVLLIDETNIAAGAIEAKLGYTPLADDGSIDLTAPQRYAFSPTPSELDPATLGYMGSPENVKNADYTLLLSDSGKMIIKSDGSAHAWTIPPNSSVAFPIGHGVWMVNGGSAGSVTVTRGAGVTLTAAGSSTNENKTLTAGGMIYVKQIDTNVWKATGAGI